MISEHFEASHASIAKTDRGRQIGSIANPPADRTIETGPTRPLGKQGDSGTPAGYAQLLEEIKVRIRETQLRASIQVNHALLALYWQIGRHILRRQQDEGWGAKVVERLARDLRREFPDLHGFSRANLLYMRAFAETYPDEQIVQQLVGRIPWGHNVVLMGKVHCREERMWYAKQVIEHGWSRAVLVHQVETGLYHRQGQAVTNFERTLPPPQSDLARQTLKDPYVFDFLSLGADEDERQLHRGLLEHLRDFLVELGVGFAFVGSEVHLEIEGRDFYLDLLFYHLHLRCYVVVELKVVEFEPEYAGKMSFYLSAVDDRMRHRDDQPSIGLIICKEKRRMFVEYALRDTRKPIGVSSYKLTSSLPARLRGRLPTVEEVEAELGRSSDR